MDNEIRKILWVVLAVDVIVMMIALMHYLPKPPVM